MNWKEFLKPDWRKIVIFVILLIIFFQYFPFPPIYRLCEPPRCVLEEGEYYYVAWDPGCPRCGTISWSKQFLSTYYYQILFIGIIGNYLLSPLIIWIYDKVKRDERS